MKTICTHHGVAVNSFSSISRYIPARLCRWALYSFLDWCLYFGPKMIALPQPSENSSPSSNTVCPLYLLLTHPLHVLSPFPLSSLFFGISSIFPERSADAPVTEDDFNTNTPSGTSACCGKETFCTAQQQVRPLPW